MFLPSQLRSGLDRTEEAVVSRAGLAELAASGCDTDDPMALVWFFGGLAVFSAVFILATFIVGAASLFLIRHLLIRKDARRGGVRPAP